MSTHCPSASRPGNLARLSRRRCRKLPVDAENRHCERSGAIQPCSGLPRRLRLPAMTNPVALITGASAGLGVEFARQLSKRGHRLVLVARRKERLDDLAKELGNARAVPLDLSKKDATAKLLDDVQANGETVDVLVNNAGFGLIGRFAELDAKRQRQMIDLNVGALTDLCRAVVPGMIERKSGSILNVASTAGFQPGPNMAVYFA